MIRGVVKKTRIFYGQADRKGPLTDFFWCVQKERCCFGPKKNVQFSNLLTVRAEAAEPPHGHPDSKLSVF